MKVLHVLFIVGIFQIAHTQKEYLNLEPSDLKMELSSLFDETKSWALEMKKMEEEIVSIRKFQGLITKDYANLKIVLDSVSALRGKTAKLVVYAALKENLDYTSKTAKDRFATALEIEDKVDAATSFLTEEIGKIPNDTLQTLKRKNDLVEHLKRINRISHEKKFRLNNETERALLSMKRLWLQSGQTHQAIFENEDLDWPNIKPQEGEALKLNLGGYIRTRKQKDSNIRNTANETFLNYLKRFEEVLAVQLIKRIETELQIARLRGFQSGIDAEFYMRDGFPIGSTKVFREAAQNNNFLVKRYCKIISKLNGSERPHYSEIYTGTASVQKNFSLGESIDIVYKATEKFGVNYKKKIDSLLKENIFDVEMKKNKRMMWAIYPPVGGANPYTIMPYDRSFRASSVLSRAVVGNLAQHHYSPDTRDDPPVYNNGVIYVGSLLHRDFFVNNAKSSNDKLTYLKAAAYGLYNSFFRYALYADFESRLEQRLIQGYPLDGKEISKLYYNTLKDYFGNDIEIPKEFAYEWMTIAQPFNTYEHQYWPVAIAAASAILDNLDNEEVMDLLVGKVTSDSDRSYQILKAAGIDFLNINVYNSLFDRMRLYLDGIENFIKD